MVSNTLTAYAVTILEREVMDNKGKMGIFILGETDYVSYQHTFKQAKELADHGASYIVQNLKQESDPVSIVGLMLDADWVTTASDEQKGVMGGIISGICWDTVLQSRTYHTEQHSRFQTPCFLFTSFKQNLDDDGYRYFVRMVGVVEWKDPDLMCLETIQAFKAVQAQNPIIYAADSASNIA